MMNQANAGAERTTEPAEDPFARTGKERAALVERDYFRRRPPLDLVDLGARRQHDLRGRP